MVACGKGTVDGRGAVVIVDFGFGTRQLDTIYDEGAKVHRGYKVYHRDEDG